MFGDWTTWFWCNSWVWKKKYVTFKIYHKFFLLQNQLWAQITHRNLKVLENWTELINSLQSRILTYDLVRQKKGLENKNFSDRNNLFPWSLVVSNFEKPGLAHKNSRKQTLLEQKQFVSLKSCCFKFRKSKVCLCVLCVRLYMGQKRKNFLWPFSSFFLKPVNLDFWTHSRVQRISQELMPEVFKWTKCKSMKHVWRLEDLILVQLLSLKKKICNFQNLPQLFLGPTSALS